MIRFLLNDKSIETDLPPGMVILDFIRYHKHLMGTKIGCREGDCGACTILVGSLINEELVYQSMTSCLMPLANAEGKHIVTIEGINLPGELNPIQQAMADEGATQCGFCTPGFVVSLAGYCLQKENDNPIAAIDGNICRCTGYKSIERAAATISDLMKKRKSEEPAIFVARKKILPEYFSGIKVKLKEIHNLERLTTDYLLPTFVGGGTDLYVQKHEEMVHGSNNYVFDQPSLNWIKKEVNNCVMGPSVTVTDLKNSSLIQEAFPSFQRYVKLVSSTPIRNMATVAGNFANASPIGDFTIFFLALDAVLTLSSGRTIPLRKFYKGYKQLDKSPDELITSISFELPGKNDYFNFEKVSKRTHLDIATVNTAIHLVVTNNRIQKAGISAGGVGPIPLFLQKTSAFLEGKEITDSVINEAITLMQTEITPISDVRGSKEYKTLLLGQLIRAHFNRLLKKEEIL